jgi:hypothetical protein
MDDPVAIALKRGAQAAGLLWLDAARGVRFGGEWRELLRLQRANPGLEGRSDVSLGERGVQICRMSFHGPIVARHTGEAGPN